MDSARNLRKAYGLRERILALRPPRVLLAEDDPDVRRLVATALRSDGYGVLELPDGDALLEGIASALLFGSITGGLDGVELLISDVRMPRRSGLDVLLSLREANLAVAVILMTAYPDAETRAEASRLGALALLPKPFDLDSLLGTVRALTPADPRAEAPSSWRVQC